MTGSVLPNFYCIPRSESRDLSKIRGFVEKLMKENGGLKIEELLDFLCDVYDPERRPDFFLFPKPLPYRVADRLKYFMKANKSRSIQEILEFIEFA